MADKRPNPLRAKKIRDAENWITSPHPIWCLSRAIHRLSGTHIPQDEGEMKMMEYVLVIQLPGAAKS